MSMVESASTTIMLINEIPKPRPVNNACINNIIRIHLLLPTEYEDTFTIYLDR